MEEQTPMSADDYWIVGSQHFRCNDFDAAREAYEKALELRPTHAYVLNNLGVIEEKQGKLTEAVKYYEQANKKMPDNAVIEWNLGKALMKMGKKDEGLRLVRKASELINRPRNPFISSDGSIPSGVRSSTDMKSPQDIDPTEVYFSMAEHFLTRQQFALVESSCRKALKSNPNHVMSMRHLADSLGIQDRDEEAIQVFEKINELAPDDWMSLLKVGELHTHLWNTSKVVEKYKLVTRMLEEKGWKKCVPAIDGYPFVSAPALQINMRATYLIYVLQMVFCLQKVAYWPEYSERIEYASEILEYIKENSSCHFPSFLTPEVAQLYPLADDKRSFAITCVPRMIEAEIKELNKPAYKHPKRPLGNRRLRVGYALTEYGDEEDFDALAVMDSVIGMHDRSKFEIFAYLIKCSRKVSSLYGDGRTAEIKSPVSHMVDLRMIEQIEAADQIYRDRIDILIGLTATVSLENRLFEFRPAPIQVAWLGNLCTSGSSCIDYFITDSALVPMKHSRWFSEKLAYMPDSCFVGNHATTPTMYEIKPEPNTLPTFGPEPEPSEQSLWKKMQSLLTLDAKDDERDEEEEAEMTAITVSKQLRRKYNLPMNKIVYGCLTGMWKSDPSTADMWIEILKRVPKSVLWLVRCNPAVEENVKKYFEKQGINPKRVLFCDKTTDRGELIKRIRAIDVYLDTVAWNTGALGLDVLWMGVPLVTLPKETLMSRMSASQLTAIGCQQLVAQNQKNYVDLAVNLGKDPIFLNEIRSKLLKNRHHSSLFDVEKYCRNFEKLLLNMWRRYEDGSGPDHIVE